jgi:Fic family protein
VEAEVWRQVEIDRVYVNYTNEELDNASRWINYADPFSEFRTCSVDRIYTELMIKYEQLQNSHPLSTLMEKKYLAQHAYYTTGIEGNTLSLPETLLIIKNEKLYVGYRDDMVHPLTNASITEVQNIKQIISSLGLHQIKPHTQQRFVGINSAILKDMNVDVGYRRLPVAIGHQKVLLPMPDEVPYLMSLYIVKWLDEETTKLRNSFLISGDVLNHAVELAYTTHTRLVHIHPFSDGNGRLARVISGLTLQIVGLPMPMLLREDRYLYCG